MRNGFEGLHVAVARLEWKNWVYRGRVSWPQAIWFLCMMSLLAWLDRVTAAVWLVPPFAATLTILLLLPRSPIAQPIPVVAGTTLASGVGTVVARFAHGPAIAALVAAGMVVILPLLRIYHPPGVALSMYPLLLHTNVWFPVAVVLPFTSLAVLSCSILSRIFKSWADYPLPLRREADSAPRRTNEFFKGL